MFGQLKESVLTNLEKEYAQNGETKFKKQFAKYVKVLKENKSLKEFNEIYDLLNNMRFDNELVAKEFVEESINHLKKLNLSETDELKSLVENVVSIDGTINHSIDELVFNEKITILDNYTLEELNIKLSNGDGLILIALYISNWNENNRVKERSYSSLKRIKTDLITEAYVLKDFKKRYRYSKEYLKNISLRILV